MPTFELERNGVPFTVRDAESEEVANQLLDETIEQRPDMLSAKAAALGMDFDFETNQGRERTAGEEFAIGAGQQVQEVLDFVGDIFNPDELTALELNRRANDQKAFAVLDDQGFGAEDFGSAAAQVGMLMIGAPGVGAKVALSTIKAAGKGGLALARMATGLSLFGAAARTFVKVGAKKKLTNQVMQQASTHPAGRAAIKKLTETTNPKTVETLVNTISREATKKVRAAQIRIQRGLREQEAAGGAVGAAESQAVRQGAQQATTRSTAQEGLKAEAKDALQVESAGARDELIKGIGFKKGQNVEQAARARRELIDLIKRS